MMADALMERIREAIEPKYFWNHPFMKLFYAGKLARHQIKGWIINRYYYQKSIPIKDAIILSKCNDPDMRKIWLLRLARREGLGGYLGDIEGWARFAEAAGIPRDVLENTRALPAVEMAVNSYLDFVKRSHWLYSVAATLPEMLALEELPRRMRAIKEKYDWIDSRGLDFFLQRLSYLSNEVEILADALNRRAVSKDHVKRYIKAALLNCEIHWAILDAVFMKYVVSSAKDNYVTPHSYLTDDDT